MRIAVLGICQAHSYAHALAHLFPEAEVQSFEAAIVRNRGKVAEVAGLLEGFDLVFSQRFSVPEMGALGTPSLRPRCRRLLLLPRIVFPGYHPDMIYLAEGQKQYGSPVGAYHSAIAAAGFALGLDEAATLGLFNRFVYRRLGYLDEFARARDFLIRTGAAECGLDLAAAVESWHRRGPFMFTINHPRMAACAGIAHAAALRHGLLPAATPVPEVPSDPLATDTIWPVYPEIAEELGLPEDQGGLLFKRVTRPIQPLGNRTWLSLAEFVAESFAMYRDCPATAFEGAPVVRIRTALEAVLVR